MTFAFQHSHLSTSRHTINPLPYLLQQTDNPLQEIKYAASEHAGASHIGASGAHSLASRYVAPSMAPAAISVANTANSSFDWGPPVRDHCQLSSAGKTPLRQLWSSPHGNGAAGRSGGGKHEPEMRREALI